MSSVKSERILTNATCAWLWICLRQNCQIS